jgi:nucleoside-diphosphate-sugar epimerase
VTGAFGCIGAWCVAAVVARGHFVVAYDLGDDDRRLRIALDDDQLAAVVHVQGDVTDRAQLGDVIEEYAITNVIHLAALQVPFCRADPPRGAHVNVVGTINVLDAVRERRDRMRHVVYASSIAVYASASADGTGPAHTNGGLPATLYGVFKRADESAAALYYEDFGVSSIGLRPHTVYGPGRDQGLTAAPTLAMLAASRGERYHIPFGGQAQYQYAPDVGEAFVRASELSYRGASVHTLDGPVASIAEVISAIEAAAPAAVGLITAEDAPLPFPPEADSSSFVELIGAHTTRALPGGVRETISNFQTLARPGASVAGRVEIRAD